MNMYGEDVSVTPKQR